ncbi:MAG: hypothetical protein P9F19_01830 [Candidatus Contendobacter sp.]|nr:hypothetical protein [Candidatus Contendobacter sp.]MDG4556129.1 hypothetical protein [Candidatus Contendobacter sp.]
MKFRHILLVVLAALTIAFLQPLVTFLGGLMLLVGTGALIFRDLTPAGQDALERRMLGWLRRARGGSVTESGRPATSSRRLPSASAEPGPPGERPRRSRTRIAASANSTRGDSAPPPP